MEKNRPNGFERKEMDWSKSLEYIFKIMCKNNPREVSGTIYVLKIRQMPKGKAS